MMKKPCLLAILALLGFYATARADDPSGEESPLDLATLSECVEFAMYEMALCPGDYENLHDFLVAAKTDAANDQEQTALLDQVDLAGGEVHVGEHLYTGRVVETGHDSYADGGFAFWFDFEITETATGRIRTFTYFEGTGP